MDPEDMTSAPLWKYMDSRSWFDSLPWARGFVPGDVFIEKCQSKIPEKTTEATTRAGQAILSRVSNGSSNSAHALILLDPETMLIAESSGQDGPTQLVVRRGDFTVYRCMDRALRNRAAEVADYFTKPSPGFTPGGYARVKCAQSPPKSKNLGPGGEQYLDNLANIWASRGGLCGDQVCDDMFCSEFVIAMYELAHRRQDRSSYLFGVDPRAMSVKAMEAQLNSNALFQLLGRRTF
jgi:hypothetical protein